VWGFGGINQLKKIVMSKEDLLTEISMILNDTNAYRKIEELLNQTEMNIDIEELANAMEYSILEFLNQNQQEL
tara:strand:- start:59 stop:277 length:219 start_codon:yes stop_codon:yes gene_type:complete